MYWEMAEKCVSRGWRMNDQPAEVTCRGFEDRSAGGFGLKELICGLLLGLATSGWVLPR